jgi:hypothetical protein
VDGAERSFGRRHRLVKLRVPGIGYASLANIDADWSEADVALSIDAWWEQTADNLRLLAAAQLVRRTDNRERYSVTGVVVPRGKPAWGMTR